MTIVDDTYLVLRRDLFARRADHVNPTPGILIGVELVLNAANINLVAFSKYQSGVLSGHIFAVFVILLAAAEAAIAIAIFMNFYNSVQTIDVDRGDTLRG
jgi:NADH-quinone oxidoreductase subunit K